VRFVLICTIYPKPWAAWQQFLSQISKYELFLNYNSSNKYYKFLNITTKSNDKQQELRVLSLINHNVI
jgi:hypothetical protein